MNRRVVPLLVWTVLSTSSCSWDPLGSYADLLKSPEDARHPRFELTSRRTGTTYTVYVRLPLLGSGPFPSLYYLDADAASRRFSREYDRLESEGITRPTMLIGVGYGDVATATELRTRDLTPPAVTGPAPTGEWGGASDFAAFLVDELLPEVEDRYPVSTDPSDRALFGHSLGGLFAGWLALERPGDFRGYCSASASFNWDSGSILGSEDAYAEAHADLAVDWHFGGTDAEGPPLYAYALLQKLRSRSYASLRISTRWYHTGSHGTSWRRVYPDAAAAIFPTGVSP